MIVIATLSNQRVLAAIVDLEARSIIEVPSNDLFKDTTIIDRPEVRPFGITWDESFIYLSNNRQLVRLCPRQLQASISCKTLQPNSHQLTHYEGRIWSVSPWTNSIITLDVERLWAGREFDLLNHNWKEYVYRDGSLEDDRHHFNSITIVDGVMYVMAHRFLEPSRIYVYDHCGEHIQQVIHNVGFEAHGIAKDGNQLYWLSSGTNELRGTHGFCLPIERSGYLRGLCVTHDFFIVGISPRKNRGVRKFGDGWLQVISRKTHKLEAEMVLRGSGAINDIRILDSYDFGHHQTPFLSL